MHQSRRAFLQGGISLLPGLLIAGSVRGSGNEAMADNTITPVEYKGWKNCWRLSNGTIEVIVVPEIGGRIMRYGFVGGPNQLWENPTQAGKPTVKGEWTNHGGEKAWPWPQELWDWPPPFAADQAPYRAQRVARDTESGLALTSSQIDPLGVHIYRSIFIASKGTAVYLTTELEGDASGQSVPLAAWSIAQVPAQPVVYARLVESASAFPGSIRKMSDTDFKAATMRNGVFAIERSPSVSSKIGLDADLLATVQDDTLFCIHGYPAATLPEEKGNYTPGERAQIYNQPDNAEDAAKGITPYIELEFTGTKRALKQHDTIMLNQQWNLHHLKEKERSPEAVSAFLANQIRFGTH